MNRMKNKEIIDSLKVTIVAEKEIAKAIGLPENSFGQLHISTLNLINQQGAEIERLKKLLDGAETCIDELEYALDKVGHSNSRVDDALEKYNNLKQQMVGDSE